MDDGVLYGHLMLRVRTLTNLFSPVHRPIQSFIRLQSTSSRVLAQPLNVLDTIEVNGVMPVSWE
jgi:hypothetical protein